MAQVLLTHSYHLPFDSKQLRKMQPYSPIGTLYAATALRQHGLSVAVFDTMLTDPSVSFTTYLDEHKPRVVAVYEDDFNFLSKMCLTRMRQVAWDIASAAKAIGAVTIVHGSDSTDHPGLFLHGGFDYVLCGESEEVLAQLCDSLVNEKEIPELDGMVRLDLDGSLVFSKQRLAMNPSWSDLCAPSRDLIDLDPYRSAWGKAHGFFSINMVSSRGCPFRCNWCAKPISGNRFHLRSPKSVADEMKRLKTKAKVDHIWFGDDVFALNQHWVQQFAEEVVRLDAAVPFKIQSRADLMSERTVDCLRAAGCTEVWMGVESGSQKVLNAMNKGIQLSSVVAARSRLKDAGIGASYFLQFGYPGETWTELRQTIDFVRDTRPDDIGISFSYPLPGTSFYERVKAQLGEKSNWTDSDDLCILFKAAYNTDFYRAVREALHAEVESWGGPHTSSNSVSDIGSLWTKVYEMEPLYREPQAFNWALEDTARPNLAFVPLNRLVHPSEA